MTGADFASQSSLQSSSQGDLSAPLTEEQRLAVEVKALRKDLETQTSEAVRLQGILVAERSRMTDFQEFYTRCVADLEAHNAKRTTTRTHAVRPEVFALLAQLLFPVQDTEEPQQPESPTYETRPPPASPPRESLPTLDASSRPNSTGRMPGSNSQASLNLDTDTLTFLQTLTRRD